jgi:hypothetical protein
MTYCTPAYQTYSTFSYNVWSGGDKCGSTDISVANDGFVDASTADLRLTCSSPAIDFVPLSIFPGIGFAAPTRDLLANLRSDGSKTTLDAGAFETRC